MLPLLVAIAAIALLVFLLPLPYVLEVVLLVLAVVLAIVLILRAVGAAH